MWSAIFGAEQALHAEQEETPLPLPSPPPRSESPPPSSSSSSKPPPPVSPADTASSTPRSSYGDLSTTTTSSTRSSFGSNKQQRPSNLLDHGADDSDSDESSALAMVLRRMNALMVRAGEHEFEKRVLVDQMDKDRAALERQVQALQDQNAQLQYKAEYNSEPMLMERLQDAMDMRDAMTAVKLQLEKDVQDKEKTIAQLHEQLLQNEEALMQLQAELEEEKQQREHDSGEAASRIEALKTELLQATEAAEWAAQDQLAEAAAQLGAVTMERDAIARTLAETKQQLEAATQDKMQEVMELAAEVQRVQQAGELRAAELEQAHEQRLAEMEQAHASRLAEWKQSSDHRVAEKDQQLEQLKRELTEHGQELESRLAERVAELEAQLEQQAQETDTRVTEMNQVLEDYKHDCMELWKLNEDLKQQAALASADAMLKEAEFRQHEFSMQSRVAELESQVEELNESINRKEQELVLKEEELINVREDAAAAAQRLQDEAENNQPWQENAIRVLTEQVATAQRELSDAMELNLHVNNRNSWLEEQGQQLVAETEAAKANAAAWEQSVHAIQQQLEAEQRSVADHVSTIQRWEQQWAESTREMDAVRQRADEEKLAMQRALDEANGQVASLQSDLDGSRADAAAALAQAEERVREAEQQAQLYKDQLASEVEQIRASPIVDHAAMDAKQREIEALQGTVDSLRLDVSALQQTNDENERRVRELEAQVAQKQSELEAVQASSSSAPEGDVESLRESNKQLQNERDILQSALVKACQEVDAFKLKAEQIVVLVAEKETIQDDLELAQATLAEAEAELAAKLGAIRALEVQVANLQAAAQDSSTSVGSIEEELARVYADLEEKTRSAEQLERSLMELQANVGNATQQVQRELDGARALVAKLEAEVVHLQASEHALQLQVQDAVAITQQLEIVQAERKAIEAQLTRAQQELEDATARLESERAAAHHELAAVLAAKRELQDQVDDLRATLDREHEATGAQQQQIAPLRAQLEALTHTNQSLIAEITAAREEWETKDARATSELQTLQTSLSAAKVENVKLTEAFQAKDAEFQSLRDADMAEILKMRSTVDVLTDEKTKALAELAHVRAETAQLREANEKANAERGKLVAAIETHVAEVNRLQTQLKHAEAALGSGQQAAEQARVLQEEKNRVVDELRQLEIAHRKAEEATRELDEELQKSKQSCGELEFKVSELQASLQQAQEERAAESAHLAILNGSLRHEIEQLAESRYEQERYIEELRLQQADLQAEKNVLAARAHRLTQELSQYTELPEEDTLADAHTQAPDLWELLSSGMEQLKADLELASKYASSIEGSGVLESDDNGPEAENPMLVSS